MHTLTKEQLFAASVKLKPEIGVYFLFNMGELVYVGQSTNVFVRICAHTEIEFDAYTVISCSDDQLRSKEAIYINLFMPPGNRRIPGRKNASVMGRQARKKYAASLGMA